MKYFLIVIFLLQSSLANAQSSCSSDNTVPLKSIQERFTNADCDACWTKPLMTDKFGITLDWLAPSSAGDDAPLSAAANRDALLRLENLKITLPKEQQVLKTAVPSSRYSIRVAHGLAVAGYIGTSIEMTRFSKNKPAPKNLTAVLLLTETIAKGTADSPIERNLVRNMLIESWTGMYRTRRPMSIPAGVNPDNLRVVGWVQDEKGRILAAAQSKCIEPK